MAILAASVINKSGKVLVSRQFLEMPRSRVEGLMASFPKLVPAGTQHTTVDTDDVRFVYQPLDDLYLVLTTSKMSNILQDISSLHLFARVVGEYCKAMTEREVLDRAFELVAAFDELVSLGYRENVNLQALRTIMLMDSNEERIQEMIKRNKEMEAKEQSRLKAKQMELQRKQMARAQAQGFGPGAGAMGGMGGGGMGGQGGFSGPTGYGQQPMGSFGQSSGGYGQPSGPFGQPAGASPFGGAPSYTPSTATNSPPRPAVDTTMKTGMKLGGPKQGNDLADMFGGLPVSATAAATMSSSAANAPAVSASTAVAPASIPQPKEPVHVLMDERITVIVNRDGGLQQMEVKGDLTVHATIAAASQARVQVSLPAGTAAQFKTHPNMDKKVWAESNTLALRDTSKSFPLGQPTGVLKWRLVAKDEDAVPLTINCWPNPTADGHCEVNIEYELQQSTMRLRNVVLAVPVPPTPNPPVVSSVDGTTHFDRARSTLFWQIPEVSSDAPSGSLDFKAQGGEPGAYFPVAVNFQADTLYCPVTVVGAVGADGAPIEFGVTTVCQPDEYKVV